VPARAIRPVLGGGPGGEPNAARLWTDLAGGVILLNVETGKAVALAGIAATAVVGIAGSTAGWLIARADRANQRAVAHDDRVYERRSDTYLAALAVIEQQRRQFDSEIDYLFHEGGAFRPPRQPAKSPLAARDDPLFPRLLAFGSRRIVHNYVRLGDLAQDAERVELDAWNRWTRLHRSHPKSDGEEIGGNLLEKLEDDQLLFGEQERRFERLVERELS
jgi:hypothetical protein